MIIPKHIAYYILRVICILGKCNMHFPRINKYNRGEVGYEYMTLLANILYGWLLNDVNISIVAEVRIDTRITATIVSC